MLFRSLRYVCNEKDLEQMQATIRNHIALLNVYLNTLQAEQISMSAAQSSEILELIQKLRIDVSKKSGCHVNVDEGTIQLPVANETTKSGKAPEAQVPDIEGSLSRLAQLVEETDYTVESDSAERLIQDLQCLLDSAQKHEDSACCSICGSRAEDGVSKELKFVTNLVSAAPSIAINRNGMIFQASPALL